MVHGKNQAPSFVLGATSKAMDIFFQDPDSIPLPPDAVRLRSVKAELSPDQRRVRVAIQIDPFLKPPSLELTLTDARGDELAQTHIIETATPQLELILHIRKPDPSQPYILTVLLFYSPALAAGATELPARVEVDRTDLEIR